MHAGYYLLVLACIILQYNAEQCNMHASLYYEYGMMLCINNVRTVERVLHILVPVLQSTMYSICAYKYQLLLVTSQFYLLQHSLPVCILKPVHSSQVRINIDQIIYRPIKRLGTSLVLANPGNVSPPLFYLHNLNHVSVSLVTLRLSCLPSCQPVLACPLAHTLSYTCCWLINSIQVLIYTSSQQYSNYRYKVCRSY